MVRRGNLYPGNQGGPFPEKRVRSKIRSYAMTKHDRCIETLNCF